MQHHDHHDEQDHQPAPSGAPTRPGRGNRPRDDWFDDEEYVSYWIKQQDERADERNRQFHMIRALVPKLPDQPFRYLNLGAGPGHLDEVLLERFPEAEVTLLDGSFAMLAEARKRLDRFEGRAEFVQANLATPDWTGGVTGPFDLAVSTSAIHHLRDPRRVRELYAEIFPLIGHGGLFLNFDYVRLARPALDPLAAWAKKDPEAGFIGARDSHGLPGTVEEHLGWLREGGFAIAECLWREFQLALMVGVRDHIHLPTEEPSQGARTLAVTLDGISDI